jgi:hypothetical protein
LVNAGEEVFGKGGDEGYDGVEVGRSVFGVESAEEITRRVKMCCRWIG